MTHEHLHFFRDAEGTPHAEGLDADARVLALFLESDVQDDANLCRRLLARITVKPLPNADPIAFIGNSFDTVFEPKVVRINGHSEGNDHAAVLPPHQVELALQGWLEFIES